MQTFQLTPEFKARAAGLMRPFTRSVEPLSQRIFSGAGKAAVGAVAGWGAVMLVGALMMTHASRENCCAPEAAPAVAVKDVAPPAPAAPTPKADLAALAAASAAPSPAPAAPAKKSTDRIDMSPTAAIADPAVKTKHKHKKKPGDLDKHP